LGCRTKLITLVTAGIVFCAALEIAQLYVPGRHARLSDFVIDSLATCAGLVLGPLTRVII
jgi:VanZ family protein